MPVLPLVGSMMTVSLLIFPLPYPFVDRGCRYAVMKTLPKGFMYSSSQDAGLEAVPSLQESVQKSGVANQLCQIRYHMLHVLQLLLAKRKARRLLMQMAL